jgi:hypothetical protein
VAVGYAALYSNQPTSVTNGISNTAVGTQALFSNTTGNFNTAYGRNALNSNTTGNDNIANGLNALFFNNTGNNNIGIGNAALSNNVGGNNNIAIGTGSGTGSGYPNLFNTIGIGNDGVYQHGGSNQTIIGNFSMLFIGGKVNWGIPSDARIKNTIMEDVKGLDFISRLRPVTYYISNKAITAITGTKETPDFPGKYDCEKIKYSGFIAQEVEQAAKTSGYEFSGYDTPKNEFGLYTIKYAEFVVPLVKAMQEQQVIIETLQKQAEAAKTEIPVQIGKQQAIIEEQNKKIEMLLKEIQQIKDKLK